MKRERPHTCPLDAQLDERFHFTLDVAASHENAKCDRYLTLEDAPDDGLGKEWEEQRVWCNPPYSQIRVWVEKAWSEWGEGCWRPELIVMLLPANRPEQAWWQDLVEPYRDRPDSPLRTEFLRGRQRFVLPGAESIGPNERPPFGCVLLVWSLPLDALHTQEATHARKEIRGTDREAPSGAGPVSP